MKTKVKYFYSDLVDLDEVFDELAQLDVSPKEKEDLMDIAHINLHQAIVETVLSHLSEADKRKFLELMAEGRDEKIWEHITNKVEKIEIKISDAAEKIKQELKEDIRDIKAA